ncbi:MAG: FAD-dependent oxidoreductase [Deltaproteobacteria bacterium]|nr:FAD-dependent oxidoreductase [Deltaproteobacteria bacterium]
MKRIKRKVVVIGGGPAGLAAAISAKKAGCDDVLLIERARILGGILNQCIHDGFGLHRFKEALSGPEYAQRFIDEFRSLDIDVMTETIVLTMDRRRVLQVSSKAGLLEIQAGAVVLAMGCRERTAGAISLPGTRPAGVYTAGFAQNVMNLENMMVGKRAVVLGSGDIGLIMARRLTLEGAKVLAVFEILPYSSGLPRNIQQCLNDYDIPLFLSTTVIKIHGEHRIDGVTVAQVDDRMQPIQGTERYLDCDTLLLSVGLIPENELSQEAGVRLNPLTNGAFVDDTLMTSVPGVFACGNVLHVHDLVDHVSAEADSAGKNAADYVQKGKNDPKIRIPVTPGEGIRYTLPQTISGKRDVTLSFRVEEPARNRRVMVCDGDRVVKRKKVIRLHPAEMVQIPLKKDILKDVRSLKVYVE